MNTRSVLVLAILVVVIIALLPHVSGHVWGYGPSGLLGLVLLIVLCILLVRQV